MSTDGSSVTQEDAIAVSAVLKACDHYAALDAPREASVAELRRCYLQVSVLVHPDKNKHPEATRAFQRVSAAWAVLSDARKRQSYDAELVFGEQDEDVQMSAEEAFAAFAFAAACAAGGAAGGASSSASVFGDVAETLLWAQQLNQFGTFQQHLPGQGSMGSESYRLGLGAANAAPVVGALAAAAGGIALSVGLWSAGLFVSLLGLPRLGSNVRRLALVNCLSQIAISAQVPAVRESAFMGLTLASRKAKTALLDFASTRPGLQCVTSLAERLHTTGTAAANTMSLMIAYSGKSSCFQRRSCLPARALDSDDEISDSDDYSDDGEEDSRNAGQEDSDEDSDEGSCKSAENADDVDLQDSFPGSLGVPACPEESSDSEIWKPRVGCWVKLCNLQKTSHLEGRLGEILDFDSTSERYRVQLIPPRDCGNEFSSDPETFIK
eukprot:CAMPEP_0197632760 /NCGR_PEP_ID=MMETSP1338-20131121/9355_1 /TAXON_ID=43686 ORGANISM="Pelagodinium beii, Strain RCC1491" /NCGR_SAMPLE_ID=MMETSP1338 /ASSEMBLY_ACC=CAM_ASM_000754 /LENGTH=437 /DNA_ID=CAMNT_0043204331 /DNA_START=69 /DNA_END=1379 /DNA_ORIENTATION=+